MDQIRIEDKILQPSSCGLSQPHPVFHLDKLPKYQYEPLEDANSIRILVLEPGEPDDPLVGKLEFVNIDSAESYEPISYTWAEPGPPNRKYEIFLHQSGHDRMLELRSGSLFAALIRVRSAHEARRVWADQICINQDDLREKGQQIPLMNNIYKNAHRVLVWLGVDVTNEAQPAFELVNHIDQVLQDEVEHAKFHVRFTRELESQSMEEWKALHSLTSRDWFKRGWVVQEVGTKAPATLFWGDFEIDWLVLHRVCEKLTDYHHLRSKFDILTSDIKFLFQRFIEPSEDSYHANRFNFLYELHRARGLKFSVNHDRVFAFLGHYSLYSLQRPDSEHIPIKADYTKTVEQVYIDLATRALKTGQGNSALIALAAVQHVSMPSWYEIENQTAVSAVALLKGKLPSWVPDWRAYQGFILSEPINPHYAHGTSKPKLEIDEHGLTLRIHGLEIDAIHACSRVLKNKEFHGKTGHGQNVPSVRYLWHEICQRNNFNLDDKYVNGEEAFFAFMQTLSNGCVQVAGREGKSYHEIPRSRWIEQAALYLVRVMGETDAIAPVLLEIAQNAECEHAKEEWSRSANGASKSRRFARTKKGYYVLGPAVMEEGDVVCVLFGGKLPFCLRPVDNERFMLVGECYTHGLMQGEAIDMMDRNELPEKLFEVV